MNKLLLVVLLTFILSGCSSFSAALPVFGVKFQEFNDGLIDASRAAHAAAKTYTCGTMRVTVLLEAYPTQEAMNAWAAYCLHSKPKPIVLVVPPDVIVTPLPPLPEVN